MVDGRAAATDSNGQDSSHPRSGSAKRGRGASPNGTESTPAKRSRVSRACDQCRASREKCDGHKPICQTCDSQKRSCTYDEPPKKRGIQPNYIRTLELTLAWLFKSVPDTQVVLSRSLPDVNGPAQRYAHAICCRYVPRAFHLQGFRKASLLDLRCIPSDSHARTKFLIAMGIFRMQSINSALKIS